MDDRRGASGGQRRTNGRGDAARFARRSLGNQRQRVAAFDQATALFGALPEFDSMAVAALLTGIEERFAILIEDDDAEAEDFMTYGRLLSFAKRLALN